MRGLIKTIASVALIATTVNNIGGASAAIAADLQRQEQVVFSDRFLTSLGEVDANDAAAVIEGGDKEDAVIEEMGDDRRRLSWWSLMLMVLKPPPCDPEKSKHPCPGHPPPKQSGGGSGSSGYSGYESDAYIESSYNEDYDSQKSAFAPGGAAFPYIIAAAAAAVAAIGAIAVGARRKQKQKYHKLHGSVKQRMKIFNGFATECFEGRAESGAQCGELAPNSPGMQVV